MSGRSDRAELGVACPTCGAGPDARCVSATGKPTNPHVARLARAMPAPTPKELAQRQHERRQYAEQFSPRTLVTISFSYTCGCHTEPSEPIPLSDANVYPARAVICDEHDEYAVVCGVDVRLVADETTLLRILRAADIDPGSAAYVAADQSDESRHNRIALGLDGGPT